MSPSQKQLPWILFKQSFFYKTKLFKGLACFLNQDGYIYYFAKTLFYLSIFYISICLITSLTSLKFGNTTHHRTNLQGESDGPGTAVELHWPYLSLKYLSMLLKNTAAVQSSERDRRIDQDSGTAADTQGSASSPEGFNDISGVRLHLTVLTGYRLALLSSSPWDSIIRLLFKITTWYLLSCPPSTLTLLSLPAPVAP